MTTKKQTPRWQFDHPPSIQEYTARFPDDAACADWLAHHRWPDGFICPICCHDKGWRLDKGPWMYECAKCHRQTSLTAGTIYHGTHLPLQTWFLATYFISTHSNGMSALQLQSKLGIGSYKSAWLLLHKLRKAMVNPDRTLLAGAVEVDESSIPFQTKNDPVSGGQGRSHDGKIMIVGAIECASDGTSRRIRLAQIEDYTGPTLKGFVEGVTTKTSIIMTDGLSSYHGMEGRKHIPRVVGSMAAHVVLPWIHKVFSNLKTLGLGVYHGFRKKHIQAYLDEFTFRWNRKRSYETAWSTLLGIGLRIPPMDYWKLIGRPSPNRAYPVVT